MKSEKHTVLVRFDNESPCYHAGLEVLGGVLEMVSFEDQFEKNEIAKKKLENLQNLITDSFVTVDNDASNELIQLFAEIEELI